jgi:polyvinyl alcohol dehydrogenase (cytochrome)
MKQALALCLCFSLAYAVVYNGGYSLLDDRLSDDTLINKTSIANLALKWTYTTYGDVTATATIIYVNGIKIAVFPDWAGYLHAVRVATGALFWRVKISTYPKAASGAYSRTNPAYDPQTGLLIIGDQDGGIVYAVNALTGACVWSTILQTHSLAQVTQSATIYNGVVYVGVTSSEEGWNYISGYTCCSFRGSMHAMYLNNGTIKWTTYMLPANAGYAGAGIWGSHPAIDTTRGLVFIGTGNNYLVPASVKSCLTSSSNPSSCQIPENRANNIVALNIANGNVVWSVRVTNDVWTNAVVPDARLALDYDFAQGPMLFTVNNTGQIIDVVGQGSKAGSFYAFRRDTGAAVWTAKVGPGNSGGGLKFGSSVDSSQIYVANNNAGSVSYLLPSGKYCTSGIYFALNKDTGKIAWSICNPSAARSQGATTVVKGGIMFASSNSAQGQLYGFDVKTGAVLWQYTTGSSNAAGASITDGTILWGSGYRRWNSGVSGTTMYAFAVPGWDKVLPPTTTTTTTTTSAPTTTLLLTTTATPTPTPIALNPNITTSIPTSASDPVSANPSTTSDPIATAPTTTTTTTTTAPITTTTTTSAPTPSTCPPAPTNCPCGIILPAGSTCKRCKTNCPSTTQGPSSSTSPPVSSSAVTILPGTSDTGDFNWVPSSVTVNVNDVVHWGELDGHSVYQTISASSLVPVSNGIFSGSAGSDFSFNFTRAAVTTNGNNPLFYFRCGLHAGMFIQVTVSGIPTTTAVPTAPQPTSGTGYGGNCPAPGYKSSVLGLRYFVDPLPIPEVALPISNSTGDYYTITVNDMLSKIHTDLAPVWVRGYNGQSPGPTIVATSGRSVTVNWVNNISMWSNLLPNVETIPYGLTTTRIVTHLHGGDNDVSSDGLPEQAVDSGLIYTATYMNNQQPGMLWYHDHSMGITRSNVYLGLAGFYIIRSPSLESKMNLPSGTLELPLMIQDKIVAKDSTGQPYLYYPDSWQMQFYGEVMMVNGKIWPYVNVQPARYRLRILNASNGRFLHLRFSNTTVNFNVYGNDQGYMNSVATVPALTLSPSERVDAIVDFCKYKGQMIILQNNANAPYATSTSSNTATSGTDPCLQGRIMMFRVASTGPACGAAPSLNLVTAPKNPVMSVTLSQSIYTRDLVLDKSSQDIMPLMGTRDANGNIQMYMYEDPATEIVKAGSVETWRIINMASEAHPVHIHSSQFRILSRQKFDVNIMRTNGSLVFTGAAVTPYTYESGAKDVVTADAGMVTTLLVLFTNHVGTHLWHCHILEHEDMMMMRPLVITQ